MRIRYNRNWRSIQSLHVTIENIFFSCYLRCSISQPHRFNWLLSQLFSNETLGSIGYADGLLLVFFIQSRNSDITTNIKSTRIQYCFFLISIKPVRPLFSISDIDNVVFHTGMVLNCNWRMSSCSNLTDLVNSLRVIYCFQILVSFIVRRQRTASGNWAVQGILIWDYSKPLVILNDLAQRRITALSCSVIEH